jgi:hypothetical protein
MQTYIKLLGIEIYYIRILCMLYSILIIRRLKFLFDVWELLGFWQALVFGRLSLVFGDSFWLLAGLSLWSLVVSLWEGFLAILKPKAPLATDSQI